MKTNLKLLENTQNYRKTKKGLVTNLFHKMKSRNNVSFDLNYLQEFAKSKKFERLFIEWEKSGYKKELKPSIDRISFKKGYDKDNIHWLTWEENRFKQRMELRLIRAKKVGRLLNGTLIEIYKSVSDAVEKFGVSQGNLSSCLNGTRRTAKGYEWRYMDNSILTKNLKICNECGALGNKNATK